jgi:hypothetical protein
MLKKFFFWLAWLEHKDNTRATIIAYGLIVAVFILVFFPSWAIFGNGIKAAEIGLSISVGLVILSMFISDCFFSNPRKNWMIAIYEAEKVIKDYPEFIADYPWYESRLREVLIPFAQKIKDPADLNEFVTTHKKLFEARRGLMALQEQQKAFCDQIMESKKKIKEL